MKAALRRATALLRRAAFVMVVRVRPRSDLVRLGSDYGGWVVPTGALRPGAICYCCGVGEDATFDLALVELYGCEVFAFDPTPRSASYVEGLGEVDQRFHFVPVGVWRDRAELRFYEPRDPTHVSHSVVNLQGTQAFFTASCDTVPALMAARGHTRLAVLKLDVEGAEHAALEPVLASGAPVDVICVEFDQPASVRAVLHTVRRLRASGFELVARERWDCTFCRDPLSPDDVPPRPAP